MTFSAIKHVTYAAAGGFTVGSIAGWVLATNVAVRAAGAAYPYFRFTGLAVGVTAAVARAVDEVFKAMDWTQNVGIRLITAHFITAIVIAAPILVIVGQPYYVGKVVSAALTIAAFAVNVIVK